MQVWFNETETILSSDVLKYYAEDTSEEYRTKVGKDVESTLTSLIQQNLDIFRKQQEIKERVRGLEREYLALTTAAGVNRKKYKDIESSILRCTSLTCPSFCPKYHSKDTLNQKDAARDEQFYFYSGLIVDVGIALTVSLKDILHEPRILPIIRDFMCQNHILETTFANKNTIRMGAMTRYRNVVWYLTPPEGDPVCFVCLDSSKDDKERYRSINPLETPQNIRDFGDVRKKYPNLTGSYNYTYCNIHERCARRIGLVRLDNMFPSDDMSKVLSLTKVEKPPKDLMEIKDKYVCSTRHDSVCTCDELSLIREAKERDKQQELAAARKSREAKERAKQQEFAAARKSHEQKGPAILKFYADNKLDLLTKNINCKTCKRMKRTNFEYILNRLPEDQYDGGYQRRRLCCHSRVDKILLEYPFCVACWNFCYRCNCSPIYSTLLFCSKCRSEHSYCPFHDKYCCSVKNHGIHYDPFRDSFNLIDLTVHQHEKKI